MSFTHHDVKNAWNARNYDRVVITVPKGERKRIKQQAINAGAESTAEYIRELIYADGNKKFNQNKQK